MRSMRSCGPSATGDGQDGSTMHHGGSFGRYMELKNQKLREQFQMQQRSLHESGGQGSDIFKGVAIWVNGLTTPNHQELKQLMLRHGGVFENYYHRGTVTLVICDHLPDTKLKQYLAQRDPVPIVRAAWVAASVAAKRRLPITDFQLAPLMGLPGQTRLQPFRSNPTPTLSAGQIFPQLQARDAGAAAAATARESDSGQAPWMMPPGPDAQHSPALTPAPAGELVHCSNGESARPLGPPAHGRASATDTTRPSLHGDGIGGPAAAGRSGACDSTGRPPSLPKDSCGRDAALRASLPSGPQAPTPGSRAGVPGAGRTAAAVTTVTHAQRGSAGDDEMAAAHRLAAELRAACDVLGERPKSSADDPNFMATFFRASRLHFIGTWRARIENLTRQMAQQAPVPVSAKAAGVFAQSRKDKQPERSIIHLDMDCFFASVSMRDRPIFRGKPVAVSHSNTTSGNGEISCVTYEARKFGIYAGMWMQAARERCPQLIVLPYEFDAYQETSETVYKILMRYTAQVQPLSCDEAYLDVTGLGDPEELASRIRAEIFESTRCTASAGIGPNLLLARLATKRGKPNGQYCIRPEEVDVFMLDLKVDALPGVGHALAQKLQTLNIATVADLRAASKDHLRRELGTATVETLWKHARGIDDRKVEPPGPRKSVGAEVNWGIRFQTWQDASDFLKGLCEEVARRLHEADTQGKTVTLKLKKAKPGAPPPLKHLGHGICDNCSRSTTASTFLSTGPQVYGHAIGLLRGLAVPPIEMRGIGVTISKLDTCPKSAGARPNMLSPAKLQASVRPPYVDSADQLSVQQPGSGQAPPGPPGANNAAKHTLQAFVLQDVDQQLAPRRAAASDVPQAGAEQPPLDGAHEAGHDRADESAVQSEAEADVAWDEMHDDSDDGTAADVRPGSVFPSNAAAVRAGIQDDGAPAQAGQRREPDEDGGPAVASTRGSRPATAEQSKPDGGKDGGHTLQSPQRSSPAQSPACARAHDSDRPAGGVDLPSFDQLDPETLRELPASIRAELLQAYGVRRPVPAAAPRPAKSRRPALGHPSAARKLALVPSPPRESDVKRASPSTRAVEGADAKASETLYTDRLFGARLQERSARLGDGGRSAAAPGVPAKRSRPTSSRVRFADGGNGTPRKRAAGDLPARVALGGLTMSQIDPATLAELPLMLQLQLASSLPASREAFCKPAWASRESEDAAQGAPGASSLVHGAAHGARDGLARPKDEGPADGKRASLGESLEEACGRCMGDAGSARDVVAHCLDGGSLQADVREVDADAVAEVLTVVQSVATKACTCQPASTEGGDEAQVEHLWLERLLSLLRLLAAWDRALLRGKKFCQVVQCCRSISRLRGSRPACSCKVSAFLDKYLSEVQAACFQLHGVQLDVSFSLEQ